MDFTKEQLSDVFVKHLDREKGLQDIDQKGLLHNYVKHISILL